MKMSPLKSNLLLLLVTLGHSISAYAITNKSYAKSIEVNISTETPITITDIPNIPPPENPIRMCPDWPACPSAQTDKETKNA